ncbi:helix-turn-helix domain-containing protein [Enterococcus faecalis]|uniref:helix-turn-helix domain-containing protein n=1 Tax=Enterococcus faecalis TaxID=1351 RepID=UPI003CC649FF
MQLPQEDLAAMLSLSRQTTNALLKELQTQGIVRLGYGEIEILDAQRLREAAHAPGC